VFLQSTRNLISQPLRPPANNVYFREALRSCVRARGGDDRPDSALTVVIHDKKSAFQGSSKASLAAE
jgi:hypothetical protein